MKKAFTLIEVNLAILVMAGGILSVVVLYSLGFRESRQCREDLVSAAYADAVLGPLAGALSSPELSWSQFKNIKTTPTDGWGAFLKSDGTVQSGVSDGFSVSVPGWSPPSKPDGYEWGLVICHEEGAGLVKIGFRASKKLDALLTAPLYYTEVRFQGKQE